jgi:hypothetical protein
MSHRILSLVACSLVLSLATLCPAADDFKPEEGYQLLFKGKNLDGWKTKAGESLDGKAEAFNKRFVVADGELVIDPKVKGDVIINTTRTFAKDLVLKFEFFPDKACNNDLFLRGVKFDLKPQDVKNMKLDDWNEFEITLRGDSMELKNNGELIKTVKAKADATPLGLRAEFGALKVRRLRVKE